MFRVRSAGSLFAIWTSRAVLEASVVSPLRVPARESTTRFGVTVKYVLPTAPGVKYPVTSKITSAVAPRVPRNVIPSEPSGASAIITPLARVSPVGKLIVETPGALFGVVVRATYPAVRVLTTVRLPVTATAVDEMFRVESQGTWLLTWIFLATPVERVLMLRVVSARESTIRLGMTPR